MENQSWIITEVERSLTLLVHFVRPLAGERVRKAAEEIFSGLFFMDIGRVKDCDLRGPVEKVRQRRSRVFVVLTYSVYAPGAKAPAALLDGPF